MTTAETLKLIRTMHNYSGVFLAPTILFFAITGGLQMFGLHETSRGSTYAPPALLMHLSQLHKKGTLYLPPKRPQPPAASVRTEGAPEPEKPKAAEAAPAPAAPTPAPPDPLPIKIFFALASLGLVLSTVTGVIIAWKYARSKRVVAGTLLAGIVVPLLLLLL